MTGPSGNAQSTESLRVFHEPTEPTVDSPLTHNSAESENLELCINLEEIAHISKDLILAKTANKKACVTHQHSVCISEVGTVKQGQDLRICSVQKQPFWSCCFQHPLDETQPPTQSRIRFDKVPSVLGNFCGLLTAV